MSLTTGTGPLAGHPAGAFNFDIADASPAHRIYLAADQRRIRALVAGVAVLDTTRAHMLYETGIGPRVYAPLEDYDHDLLTATDTTSHCPFKGDASYWTVTVDGDERVDALWAYPEPIPEASWLAGLAALYPRKVDNWVVEDDTVFASLRDPFHRVDVHPSSREVVVRVDGREIARSQDATLLFETGLPVRAYLSRLDIEPGAVTPGSGKRTVCPYKGQADYWTVAGVTDAAWSYEAPLPEAVRAQGLLSFDTTLDNVEVVIGR
jgi:uncharacterized protein (DUF427 family)